MVVAQADPGRMEQDVLMLTQTEDYRNFRHPEILDQVAEGIRNSFLENTNRVSYQEFEAKGEQYRNVIATFGPDSGARLIIGAHYDVYGEQDGADDNASGVSGLLELARLLKSTELNYRIDLVAYTLEEPPFFRTTSMGSYVHAQSLRTENVQVMGMICLEMIGYFSDEKKSQSYPTGLLKPFYGGTGDFMTVVNKFGAGKFARKMKRRLKRNAQLPVKSIKAPRWLPGIDFSDHLNYWNLNYSALMITDTAFYRNENYHTQGDHIDLLDFDKMALVIDTLYLSLLAL